MLGLRGWAVAKLGKSEAGAAQIREGLTAHARTGANIVRPWNFGLVAGVYGQLQQIDKGLATLEQALEISAQHGEYQSQAELVRLKGALTLQQEDPSWASKRQRAAESCFVKAIEIAQAQQAKSLELRTVTSRCSLW